MNMCPVCGYRGLEEPPADFVICPCCGTEFGYDDFGTSHEDLRTQWIRAGARWFSDYTRPPRDWNPYAQLLNAGLAHDVRTPLATAGLTTRRVDVRPRHFVRLKTVVYA
jgi:hypothetical protein